MMELILPIAGAALCAILACTGSAIAIMDGGKAAAGVTAEKPDLFGKALVLQALPGTQGIYGFLVAILIFARIGILGGELVSLTPSQGMLFFIATLPMGVVGLISAICQGRAAVSAIHMIGRQPEAAGKAITLTAMVETYSILALLVSILLIYAIQL